MTTIEKQVRARLDDILRRGSYNAGDLHVLTNLYEIGAESVRAEIRSILQLPSYDDVD